MSSGSQLASRLVTFSSHFHAALWSLTVCQSTSDQSSTTSSSPHDPRIATRISKKVLNEKCYTWVRFSFNLMIIKEDSQCTPCAFLLLRRSNLICAGADIPGAALRKCSSKNSQGVLRLSSSIIISFHFISP